MDAAEFWEIIDASLAAHPADQKAQNSLIARRLSALTPEEIIAFNIEFDRCRYEADRWELWGAAHLMKGGGCSDDGFEYFRAWLISRGRDVYTAALKNPDSLSEFIGPTPGEYQNMEFFFLARNMYEQVTGEEADYDTGVGVRKACVGEAEWDFDDDAEISKRLPMMHARLRELQDE